MAINFKRLFWKNFLSTGNAGTTILLDRSKTTLVQGASGSGKSTMIDALCFALYGKPFRDINKPGLINSVNGKNLEVEVEFETNSRLYKIVRTIKPNKFDIFCDGKLVTQDAAVRDYQKVLEQQILQMSFKTFTQIVILGSTSFTPFMQLAQGARREVIEDILDIGIFSTMNTLLKQQTQETKDQQAEIDSEIKTLRERAEGMKRLVEKLSEKQDERVREMRDEIEGCEDNLRLLQQEHTEAIAKSSELQEQISGLKDAIEESNKLLTDITLKEAEVDRYVERQKFFVDHDDCPVCRQAIEHEHKQSMLHDIINRVDDIMLELNALSNIRDRIKEKIDVMRSKAEEISALKSQIRVIDSKIETNEERKLELLEAIVKIETESGDVEATKEELKAVAKTVMGYIEKKKRLAEQRKMQENASLLLKDSGIKTAIIREYLPLINKLLNKYLVDLQMDVEFTLDEQFNEVVKSRYRDEFVYGNFSEGEKLRIDVALMMVWRHVARVKNSASTNLLIIDEVLSGRLDPTNQDIVIDMVNNMANEGSNIFVIAHQDSLVDKFRSGIRFEKQGNFSIMV